MNSIERDELERKAFLDCDRFFLANPNECRGAFEALKPMVGDGAQELGQILDLYEMGIRCGEFAEKSILHTMDAACFWPVWTVYSHLTTGTPLYIDGPLLVAWGLGDGTPCQCMACGYRYPKPWPKCTLCGGGIGKAGEWEKRQSGAVN
jgi:hypothetical protein